MGNGVWIFGYGSLVWRPAFEHVEKRPGFIVGYERRFWQASPDHRGTREAPGRVVTLLERAGAICWGMAYLVDEDQLDEILVALDYREKAGYERVTAEVHFRDTHDSAPAALVYIATPDNENFVGERPLEEIANVVRTAHGPSGPNLQYVLELDDALAEMAGRDDHVRALADLVRPGVEPDEALE